METLKKKRRKKKDVRRGKGRKRGKRNWVVGREEGREIEGMARKEGKRKHTNGQKAL